MTCSFFDESLIDELIFTASIDLWGLNICAFQVVNIVKIEFEKLAQANIFSYFHKLHSHILNCSLQGVHKVQVVAKLGGGFKDQEFHWVRLLDLFYMKWIGTRFSCCQWLEKLE